MNKGRNISFYANREVAPIIDAFEPGDRSAFIVEAIKNAGAYKEMYARLNLLEERAKQLFEEIGLEPIQDVILTKSQFEEKDALRRLTLED